MRTAVGGATARFDIEVFDGADAAVTGEEDGDFTKYLTIDGASDAGTVTVTEVADGRYSVTFTAPAVTAGSRKYVRCRVTHATYGPRGWAEDFEVYNESVLADAIPSAIENADALLKRDVDNVEATAAVHSLASAVLKLVSKFDGATGITYRTDGTTAHMTQAVTTDGDADPISALGVGA